MGKLINYIPHSYELVNKLLRLTSQRPGTRKRLCMFHIAIRARRSSRCLSRSSVRTQGHRMKWGKWERGARHPRGLDIWGLPSVTNRSSESFYARRLFSQGSCYPDTCCLVREMSAVNIWIREVDKVESLSTPLTTVRLISDSGLAGLSIFLDLPGLRKHSLKGRREFVLLGVGDGRGWTSQGHAPAEGTPKTEHSGLLNRLN